MYVGHKYLTLLDPCKGVAVSNQNGFKTLPLLNWKFCPFANHIIDQSLHEKQHQALHGFVEMGGAGEGLGWGHLYMLSLVPRLSCSGMQTLKFCRQGKPGNFSSMWASNVERELVSQARPNQPQRGSLSAGVGWVWLARLERENRETLIVCGCAWRLDSRNSTCSGCLHISS